jgi:hypothetical protein
MKAKSLQFLTLALAIVLTLTILVAPAKPAQAYATWHVNPGESIQAEVTAAGPGDTIIVVAGTYNETVTVNKSLTMQGANAGVSAGANPGTRGAESIINGGIKISASNVIIDGFQIQGGNVGSGDASCGIYILAGTGGHTIANNKFLGPGTSITSRGILFGYTISNATIKNNEINNWLSGVYINPSSNILFDGNYIHGNTAGIGSNGISNMTVQNNNFAGNTEGWGAGIVGANVQGHNNNFVGNGVGIKNYGGQVIDATNNWWGHASGPYDLSGTTEVPPCTADYTSARNADGSGDKVEGDVLYCPWTGMESPPTPTPPPTPPAGSQEVSTPATSPFTVNFGYIKVTFSVVNSSGTTWLGPANVDTSSGPAKSALSIVDIGTTASYGGLITIAWSYDMSGLEKPENLKLYHFNGSDWVNITTSVDTANNMVYGQVTSLSPFLLGLGGCFIATAAYGSSLDNHVDTLRSFRDQYLETNPIGSAFVSLYYKVSPPMADFIEKHPTLKPIVRAGLMPAVAMSSVALNTTLAEKAAILVAIALFTAVLIMWLMRRTRRLERR